MLAIQSKFPAKHLQLVSVLTALLQALLHLALDLRELFQNLGLDGGGAAGLRTRRHYSDLLLSSVALLDCIRFSSRENRTTRTSPVQRGRSIVAPALSRACREGKNFCSSLGVRCIGVRNSPSRRASPAR